MSDLRRRHRAAYMRNYRATRAEAAIYLVRSNMLERCLNPKNKEFHRYGGRGICVCEKWIQSFDSFTAWALASGWKRGLQIDRIDNDGNYTPENCRFVTLKENSRKRVTNKLTVEKVAEIRHMLAEGFTGTAIARQYGVHHSLIYRIKLNQQWVG